MPTATLTAPDGAQLDVPFPGAQPDPGLLSAALDHYMSTTGQSTTGQSTTGQAPPTQAPTTGNPNIDPVTPSPPSAQREPTTPSFAGFGASAPQRSASAPQRKRRVISYTAGVYAQDDPEGLHNLLTPAQVEQNRLAAIAQQETGETALPQAAPAISTGANPNVPQMSQTPDLTGAQTAPSAPNATGPQSAPLIPVQPFLAPLSRNPNGQERNSPFSSEHYKLQSDVNNAAFVYNKRLQQGQWSNGDKEALTQQINDLATWEKTHGFGDTPEAKGYIDKAKESGFDVDASNGKPDGEELTPWQIAKNAGRGLAGFVTGPLHLANEAGNVVGDSAMALVSHLQGQNGLADYQNSQGDQGARQIGSELQSMITSPLHTANEYGTSVANSIASDQARAEGQPELADHLDDLAKAQAIALGHKAAADPVGVVGPFVLPEALGELGPAALATRFSKLADVAEAAGDVGRAAKYRAVSQGIRRNTFTAHRTATGGAVGDAVQDAIADTAEKLAPGSDFAREQRFKATFRRGAAEHIENQKAGSAAPPTDSASADQVSASPASTSPAQGAAMVSVRTGGMVGVHTGAIGTRPGTSPASPSPLSPGTGNLLSLLSANSSLTGRTQLPGSPVQLPGSPSQSTSPPNAQQKRLPAPGDQPSLTGPTGQRLLPAPKGGGGAGMTAGGAGASPSPSPIALPGNTIALPGNTIALPGNTHAALPMSTTGKLLHPEFPDRHTDGTFAPADSVMEPDLANWDSTPWRTRGLPQSGDGVILTLDQLLAHVQQHGGKVGALVWDRTGARLYVPRDPGSGIHIMLHGGPRTAFNPDWNGQIGAAVSSAGMGTTLNRMADKTGGTHLIVLGDHAMSLGNLEYHGVYQAETQYQIKTGRLKKSDLDAATRQAVANVLKQKAEAFRGNTIDSWDDYQRLAPSLTFDTRNRFQQGIGSSDIAKIYGTVPFQDVLAGFNDYQDVPYGHIVGAVHLHPGQGKGRLATDIGLAAHPSYPYLSTGYGLGDLDIPFPASLVFDKVVRDRALARGVTFSGLPRDLNYQLMRGYTSVTDLSPGTIDQINAYQQAALSGPPAAAGGALHDTGTQPTDDVGSRPGDDTGARAGDRTGDGKSDGQSPPREHDESRDLRRRVGPDPEGSGSLPGTVPSTVGAGNGAAEGGTATPDARGAAGTAQAIGAGKPGTATPARVDRGAHAADGGELRGNVPISQAESTTLTQSGLASSLHPGVDGQPTTVHLNDQTFAQVYKDASGKSISEDANATTLYAPHIDRLQKNLDTEAPYMPVADVAAEQAVINDLRAGLKANGGRGVSVLRIHDETTPAVIEQGGWHEHNHVGQEEYRLSDTETAGLSHTANLPATRDAFQTAVKGLTARGYTSQQIWREIPAFVTGGHYSSLGLDRAGAKALATVYADALNKAYGGTAVQRVLAHGSDVAREVAAQYLAKSTDRPPSPHRYGSDTYALDDMRTPTPKMQQQPPSSAWRSAPPRLPGSKQNSTAPYKSTAPGNLSAFQAARPSFSLVGRMNRLSLPEALEMYAQSGPLQKQLLGDALQRKLNSASRANTLRPGDRQRAKGLGLIK